LAVAVLGAGAISVLALARGEMISAAWIVVAGLCSYVVAYRFYARFIGQRIIGLDSRRATPAERLENGRDFVPTSEMGALRTSFFGHLWRRPPRQGRH
jgi:carbon starvation protein